MMMRAGVLLWLAFLLVPGRVSGQNERRVVEEDLYARAAALADTAYRAARRALNESQYRRAIDLFERSLEEEPQYASEALYYQALAYYRMGGRSNYDRALRKLGQQMERYPDAASRGDAEELMVRIEGQLARRGDAEAAERLAQEADQEAEIKAMALQALIMADAERAIPHLKRVLQNRTPETAELRGQAVFILGQHESDETLDVMLDVVRNDPDPEVKAHAAFWLSQVDDPRAIDATVEILNDPAIDEDLKGQAVFALGQTDDPRAGQILRDYASRSDMDSEVRAMAIHGLAQHPSPENAGLLKQLFGEIDDTEVREQILFALTQMPDAVDGDWLLAIFSDEAEDSRCRTRWTATGCSRSSATRPRIRRCARWPCSWPGRAATSMRVS
jgi:HEAT repeat protein